MTMYEMTTEERTVMGERCCKHIETNYNFENFANQWEKLMTGTYEKYGSWDTRTGYQSWELREV
mgnify:FL=1